MVSESRLTRALAADRAPARDPGFTLAVMRAAEAERFRFRAVGSVLRGAGLTAAASALLLPLAAWVGSNPAGLQDGVVMAGALIALVAVARLMAARATALLRR